MVFEHSGRRRGDNSVGGNEVWREQPVRGGFPDPALLALPGIARMRRFLAGGGVRPPIHYLTGAEPTGADEGSATCVMPASNWLLNEQGVISGGALAILADLAMGTAVITTLPEGIGFTTAELSMNLLEPVRASQGLITARASVVGSRDTVALSDCLMYDAKERLLAHGSSRCLAFPLFESQVAPAEPAPWTEPTYPTPHPFERDATGHVLHSEEKMALSGSEIIEGRIKGHVAAPPIQQLTGLRPATVSEQRCDWLLPASAWLASPTANVHGGAIVLLSDSALAEAMQTTVPAGAELSMLDTKTYFVRPVIADGAELRAHASVVRRGRTMAVARAEITNESGDKVAIATGSAIIAKP